MIMIEIQYRSGSRGVQKFHGLFAIDRPLTSLDKLLSKNYIYLNLGNILSHNHLPQDFITRHSLLLLFAAHPVLIRNKL